MKPFELTPYIVRKLNNMLMLYNDTKTELMKTYPIESLHRSMEHDSPASIYSFLIDAIILMQLLCLEIVKGNIDIETLSLLDKTMNKIQGTLLFFYYFNLVI